MKRTGSIGSRVGPAVTTMRSFTSRDQIILTAQKELRAESNLIHLPQTAHAFVTTGEHSFFRSDEMDAARCELRDVFLSGGMFPHLSVHGRRDENRSACRERDRCERMI